MQSQHVFKLRRVYSIIIRINAILQVHRRVQDSKVPLHSKKLLIP